MTTLDRRDLERLRHTPGEALLSRDFRDQAALDEQARWWHVRGVHGSYGVALGLFTRPQPLSGPPALILVSPGLAFDAFGRELLVSEIQQVPVPAVPRGESLALVLRYSQGVGIQEDLSGACVGEAPPPLSTAELVWLPSPTPLDGVALGRLALSEKGELEWIKDFQPPYARAFARPRIGSGATVAGGTAWETWIPDVPVHVTSLGVQVRVDTRAAGFTRTPCYFAWVQGNDADGKRPVLSLPAAEHVTATRATQFLFRTRLAVPEPSAAFSTSGRVQLVSARRSLSVCWLGIQMPHSPTLSAAR